MKLRGTCPTSAGWVEADRLAPERGLSGFTLHHVPSPTAVQILSEDTELRFGGRILMRKRTSWGWGKEKVDAD